MSTNKDDDYDGMHDLIANGKHRLAVGGLWEELGELQAAFLKSRGLTPEHKLLDIGCGCLRLGVHMVDFLKEGNYFGIDLNQELLDAGYNIELGNKGLQHKLPRTNLICNANFEFTLFNETFDMTIAQSLFTHLNFNHIRACINHLSIVMKPSGMFYATFFECPEEANITERIIHSPGDIDTYAEKDPYHYKSSDLEYLTRDLPWEYEYIGDWDHMRDQKIVAFKFTGRDQTSK